MQSIHRKRFTRKRFIRRGFIAGTAAAMAGSATIPVRAARFEYKFAHNQAVESAIYVRTSQMWREVEKETNGQLTVKIFPNSILGGETQMVRYPREPHIFQEMEHQRDSLERMLRWYDSHLH